MWRQQQEDQQIQIRYNATVYWSGIHTNRPHRRRRRPTEILTSTYCSHGLNRSRWVVLTCLRCSFLSLPSEISWIWIGRRLASSINNGAMVYNPLFPLPAFLSWLRRWCHPSTSLFVRVGRITTDHEWTGQTEMVIHVFSMYFVRSINFVSRLKYILFTVPTYAACTWV